MSLYQVAKDVEVLLHAKKFPLKVLYGPERTAREGYPENVIIFERDREASDDVREPRGWQRNPRKMRVRYLVSVATIYARNSVAGARVQDHETLCEKFVDALLVALEVWAKEGKAIELPITEARYLSFDERLAAAKEHAPGIEAAKCETWPGAVYRVKFQVPRALLDLTYAGEGEPTGSFTSLTHPSEVHGAAGSGSGENGCA